MGVQFTKMHGCGNDFIVVDNREDVLPCGPAEFARLHCRRRKDVGADGVLLIERSERAHFRMRIFNADGSEAEMCGNGARCAAMFAYRLGIAPREMTIETLAGPHTAAVAGAEVTVGMDGVSEIGPETELEAAGRTLKVHPLDSGVPHAVVFVDDAEAVDVSPVGRALRYHEFFQPRGSNADFVQVTGPGRIRLRTYERGVEAETLACGTGAIAAAVISHLRGRAGGPPVTVQVNGGLLTVEFEMQDGAARNVRLRGAVVTVCEGVLRAD